MGEATKTGLLESVFNYLQALPEKWQGAELGALVVVALLVALLLGLLGAAVRSYREDRFLLHAFLGGLIGLGNLFLAVKLGGAKLAGPLSVWWAVSASILAGAALGLVCKWLFENWDLEDLFDDGFKGLLLPVVMAALLFGLQLFLLTNVEAVKSAVG